MKNGKEGNAWFRKIWVAYNDDVSVLCLYMIFFVKFCIWNSTYGHTIYFSNSHSLLLCPSPSPSHYRFDRLNLLILAPLCHLVSFLLSSPSLSPFLSSFFDFRTPLKFLSRLKLMKIGIIPNWAALPNLVDFCTKVN